MTWNLSVLLNTSRIDALDLVTVANDATSGILVGGLVLAVFFAQMSILAKFKVGMAQAGTYSALFCFVYSVFFFFAGYLNWLFLTGFGILTALGTLYLYLEGK